MNFIAVVIGVVCTAATKEARAFHWKSAPHGDLRCGKKKGDLREATCAWDRRKKGK